MNSSRADIEMLDYYPIDDEDDEYEFNISIEKEFEDCGYSPALDECKFADSQFCASHCVFRKAFL